MPSPIRVPSRPTGRESVRPIPGNHVRLPSYRYSQRGQAPRRCAECGGAVLSDVPTADYPKVDACCLLCSRPAYELVADGWRPTPSAAEFAAMAQGKRGPNPVDGTVPVRLVRVLGHGYAIPPRELAEVLGISVEALRNAVVSARKAGHDIVLESGAYRLVTAR